MIDRRATLLGGVCLVGAAAAAALKPHRRTSLLTAKSMESVIPTSFAGWGADAYQGVAKPKLEGLAASIYEEVVQRVFRDKTTGDEVMVLIAYGRSQSDLLQLHRPEVCYPALGFQVVSREVTQMALPGGPRLSLVDLVATTGDRRENISYWTRIGEDLPVTASEQRKVMLRDSLEGFIPDGVLVRCSVISEDPAKAFDVLRRFIGAFLTAIPAAHRASLIGTTASNAMRAAVG